MAAIRRLIPPLTYSARKGQMGRIGILGGSADYTGAPYYASLSSLKVREEGGFVSLYSTTTHSRQTYMLCYAFPFYIYTHTHTHIRLVVIYLMS